MKSSTPGKHRLLIVLLSLLIGLGCSDMIAEEIPPLEEDRGVQLAVIDPPTFFGESVPLAWSPDNHEIFYVESGRIKAVHVVDRTKRTLLDDCRGCSTLTVSRDGAWLYYLGAYPRRTVYRVPVEGGSPASLLNTSDVHDYALSPDGSRLVVGHFEGDFLAFSLYDLATRAKQATYPSAMGEGLVFSPDGRAVAHGALWGETDQLQGVGTPRGPQEPVVEVTSLADGTTRTVWQGSAGLRWVQGQEQLLYLGPDCDLTIRDGTTQQDRALMRTCRTKVGQQIAWSPDGASVAVWKDDRCLENDGGIILSQCLATLYKLYLIDTRSGAQTLLGHSTFGPELDNGHPGTLTFSPDGRELAYAAEGKLYLMTLP